MDMVTCSGGLPSSESTIDVVEEGVHGVGEGVHGVGEGVGRARVDTLRPHVDHAVERVV